MLGCVSATMYSFGIPIRSGLLRSLESVDLVKRCRTVVGKLVGSFSSWWFDTSGQLCQLVFTIMGVVSYRTWI